MQNAKIIVSFVRSRVQPDRLLIALPRLRGASRALVRHAQAGTRLGTSRIGLQGQQQGLSRQEPVLAKAGFIAEPLRVVRHVRTQPQDIPSHGPSRFKFAQRVLEPVLGHAGGAAHHRIKADQGAVSILAFQKTLLPAERIEVPRVDLGSLGRVGVRPAQQAPRTKDKTGEKGSVQGAVEEIPARRHDRLDFLTTRLLGWPGQAPEIRAIGALEHQAAAVEQRRVGPSALGKGQESRGIKRIVSAVHEKSRAGGKAFQDAAAVIIGGEIPPQPPLAVGNPGSGHGNEEQRPGRMLKTLLHGIHAGANQNGQSKPGGKIKPLQGRARLAVEGGIAQH
ncbi:MAG TPA: hypothetical protein DEB40_04120 [Elusimicrobia bacterium]|nr:hypothetical protein [Elusimicrobiota bacterium]